MIQGKQFIIVGKHGRGLGLWRRKHVAVACYEKTTGKQLSLEAGLDYNPQGPTKALPTRNQDSNM